MVSDRGEPYPPYGVLAPPAEFPPFNLSLTDTIPPDSPRLDPCLDPCEGEKIFSDIQKQARVNARNKGRKCKETDDTRFLKPRHDLWNCVNKVQFGCAADPYSMGTGTPSRSPSPTGLEGVTDMQGCTLKMTQFEAKVVRDTSDEPCLRALGIRQVKTITETKKECSTATKDCNSKRKPPYENKGQKMKPPPCGMSQATRSPYGDNMSVATTDTQKILAMLDQEENLDGLSFQSPLCGVEPAGNCLSAFEAPGRTSVTKRVTSMKTVKKRPSPVHLSRMERKWSAPCGEPEYPLPCEDKPPQTGASQTHKQHEWKQTICPKNAEKPPGVFAKTCGFTGYLETHNADCLPPVAHLSKLGAPNRTCCIPNTDPCGPSGIPDNERMPPQSKPWRSGETQQAQGQLNQSAQKGDACGQRQTGKGCGPPCDPCDVVSWETGHRSHGNEEPLKLGPSLFEQDMNKPQNVAFRPPKMTSFSKTHGDPSLIKKGGCGTIKGKDCGAPSQMDAEELMAMEEDLNPEEQQQDAKKIAIYLSSDLKDQFFTDVSITTKDQLYKIHKEYLLAFTNYDIPVKEGQPLREPPSLNLCEIDGADVASVLHFLYYGELRVNIHNVLGVMAAAHAMDLVDVPDVLQEYHDKLFAPPNQTNIIDYAVCKGMECFAAYAWKVFVCSFSDHVNGCHFLNWDVRWVVNLLSHEDIPIKTELEVFEAARLWINYRLEERTDHVRTVLTCVRWTYMTAEEMVCCEREDPCLMNRPEAHELVADANWYKVMILKGKSWREFNIKPPRGAYAEKHPVNIPPKPTGTCGDRPTSAGGSCGPKVALACQTNCEKGPQDKKPKCPPRKEKDHCGGREKKKEEKGDECGKDKGIKGDLDRLPIPHDVDLYSTMSYCSLEMDLLSARCLDAACKDDIERF